MSKALMADCWACVWREQVCLRHSSITAPARPIFAFTPAAPLSSVASSAAGNNALGLPPLLWGWLALFGLLKLGVCECEFARLARLSQQVPLNRRPTRPSLAIYANRVICCCFAPPTASFPSSGYRQLAALGPLGCARFARERLFPPVPKVCGGANTTIARSAATELGDRWGASTPAKQQPAKGRCALAICCRWGHKTGIEGPSMAAATAASPWATGQRGEPRSGARIVNGPNCEKGNKEGAAAANVRATGSEPHFAPFHQPFLASASSRARGV